MKLIDMKQTPSIYEEQSVELSFSDKYDQTHARTYFDKHQDGLWRKLSNWRDQVISRKALVMAGNPNSVLDLPCGTGRFWELLSENKDREIIACDYSQDMIDIGMQSRLPEVTKRVRTIQSSAFELDLDNGSVENVFCIRLLHHVGDSKNRLKLLSELHRVTRSTVIISLWIDGNYKAWLRKKLEANRPPRKYQNRFVIPQEIAEQEFIKAGFRIIGSLDFLPKYAMWRTYVLEKF